MLIFVFSLTDQIFIPLIPEIVVIMTMFGQTRLSLTLVVAVTWAHLLPPTQSQTFRLTLNDGWSVCDSNNSICVNATVPGCIHRDLELAGKVKDFTLGFEADNQKWIALTDWIYTTTIDIPDEKRHESSRFLLRFRGLDTLASVFFNGKRIGESESMFFEYSFDVTRFIRPTNQLKVHFHSAVKEAERQARLYPYVVPPNVGSPVERGFSHPQFLRKEQSSFGWDWGPAAASMGIYQPVELVGFDHYLVSSVALFVSRSGVQEWQVISKVALSINPSANVKKLCVRMQIEELDALETRCHDLTNATNEVVVEQALVVSNPRLWWPHGVGEQKLYDLDVAVLGHGTDRVDVTRKVIGFRTVELVQEPGPFSHGLSFYFRINGRKLFLKGSNWIPARTCPANVTSELLMNLLGGTRDANMNVLRVWGGGVYESDEFYDLADQLGILLWQDAMFACAMYPTNEAFLDLVEQELRFQVRRLSSHPSVLVYAGNNENEKALRRNWYGTGGNFSLYYRDYVQLYVKTVRRVVMEEDPTRPFVTSSPSNGVLSEKEGWVAKDPSDERYGDLHAYRYIEDGWDYKSYPVGRFVSEYGLQSLPSYDSLLYAAEGEVARLDMDSEWMKTRQHHRHGNEVLFSEIQRHFQYPSPSPKPKLRQYRDFIYLTQVNQAMTIKTATEFYRVGQSWVLPDGRGGTMGAMYWQLNDVWTAPTWSSIEYSGKWKMLHYYARKFFAPLLVTSLPDDAGTSLKLYGVSDLMEDIENLTLNVSLRSSLAFGVPYQDTFKIAALPSQSSLPLANVSLRILHEHELCNARVLMNKTISNCFLTFDLMTSSGLLSHNFFFPQPLSTMLILKSRVDIVSIQLNKKSRDIFVFDLILQASDPAFFVWIEDKMNDGKLSENGFHIISPSKNVTFSTVSDTVHVDQFEISHLAMTL